MSTKDKNKKPVLSLLKLLKSTNEKEVLQGIGKSRDLMNNEILDELIILSFQKSYASDVLDIFNTIKLEKHYHYLIEAIDLTWSEEQLEAWGPVLWTSGHNPAIHVQKISQLAVLGYPALLIECFSAFDSMEGPFDLDQVTDAQIILNEYLINGGGTSVDPLIESMLGKLQEWENEEDWSGFQE